MSTVCRAIAAKQTRRTLRPAQQAQHLRPIMATTAIIITTRQLLFLRPRFRFHNRSCSSLVQTWMTQRPRDVAAREKATCVTILITPPRRQAVAPRSARARRAQPVDIQAARASQRSPRRRRQQQRQRLVARELPLPHPQAPMATCKIQLTTPILTRLMVVITRALRWAGTPTPRRHPLRPRHHMCLRHQALRWQEATSQHHPHQPRRPPRQAGTAQHHPTAPQQVMQPRRAHRSICTIHLLRADTAHLRVRTRIRPLVGWRGVTRPRTGVRREVPRRLREAARVLLPPA